MDGCGEDVISRCLGDTQAALSPCFSLGLQRGLRLIRSPPTIQQLSPKLSALSALPVTVCLGREEKEGESGKSLPANGVSAQRISGQLAKAVFFQMMPLNLLISERLRDLAHWAALVATLAGFSLTALLCNLGFT